jgi:hypothetical protein
MEVAHLEIRLTPWQCEIWTQEASLWTSLLDGEFRQKRVEIRGDWPLQFRLFRERHHPRRANNE